MTTFTQFVPKPTGPFQFQPTLDGQVYTGFVKWSLFGQRWYLELQDLSGNLILFEALIGSPTGISTASLTWDITQGLVTVATDAPHGIPVGAIDVRTISGVIPSTYNGVFTVTAASPMTLTFPMTTDPGGGATLMGSVVHNINLVAGFFDTSTLVYREQTGMFEVTP